MPAKPVPSRSIDAGSGTGVDGGEVLVIVPGPVIVIVAGPKSSCSGNVNNEGVRHRGQSRESERQQQQRKFAYARSGLVHCYRPPSKVHETGVLSLPVAIQLCRRTRLVRAGYGLTLAQSALLRVTAVLNRSWYSLEVMNAQTMPR